ncbi:MAG TPA: hypothetical protein VN704_02785 [Verrucomicrobiae bacterium]|nr:hypothetical protein [Verrucomicrobiae bacterium]
MKSKLRIFPNKHGKIITNHLIEIVFVNIEMFNSSTSKNKKNKKNKISSENFFHNLANL